MQRYCRRALWTCSTRWLIEPFALEPYSRNVVLARRVCFPFIEIARFHGRPTTERRLQSCPGKSIHKRATRSSLDPLRNRPPKLYLVCTKEFASVIRRRDNQPRSDVRHAHWRFRIRALCIILPKSTLSPMLEHLRCSSTFSQLWKIHGLGNVRKSRALTDENGWSSFP